jgi:hypothetical protein
VGFWPQIQIAALRRDFAQTRRQHFAAERSGAAFVAGHRVLVDPNSNRILRVFNQEGPPFPRQW